MTRYDSWNNKLPSAKSLKEMNELRTEFIKSQIRLNNSMAQLNELRAEFQRKIGSLDDEMIEEFREYLREKKKKKKQNPLTT